MTKVHPFSPKEKKKKLQSLDFCSSLPCHHISRWLKGSGLKFSGCLKECHQVREIRIYCSFWFWPFRNNEARNCPPVFPCLHLPLPSSCLGRPYLLELRYCEALQATQCSAVWPSPFPIGFWYMLLSISTLCLIGPHNPGKRGQWVSRAVCGGWVIKLSRGKSIWWGTGGISRPRPDIPHLIICKTGTIMSLCMCISQQNLQG